MATRHAPSPHSCRHPRPSPPVIWIGTLGERLGPSFFVLKHLHDGTPNLHRILLSHLAVAVVAIKTLQLERADPYTPIALDTIMFAVMAYGIFRVASHLKHRSGSLLGKGSLMMTSSTELAIVTLLLQHEDAARAGKFLTGMIYGKLFVMGALCLLLRDIFPGNLPSAQLHQSRSTSAWMLALSSGLIFATATGAQGEHQFVANAAPVFMLIHVPIVYFFTDTDRSAGQLKWSEQWTLHFMLVVLRTTAIALGYQLLEHLRDLADTSLTHETFVHMVYLPLITIAVDQSTNIWLAVEEEVEPWTNVIQTTMFTYFFVRPLAALVRSGIDPAGGHKTLAFCLIVAAACSSIPRVPMFAKGAALLLTYIYASFICLTRPGGLESKLL